MALCHGVEACDQAATALLDRLSLRLGGAHIYIPQERAMNRARVIEEIRRRFDGTNVNGLAREYGLSTRHVRRILMK
jgi:Mor family transcriptional regulator